jgi:hypothetical protein
MTTPLTAAASAAYQPHQPSADVQQRTTLVQDSLERAERHLRRVQRFEARALVVSLLASAAATVLAGVPAIANRAAGGWRLTCALTAILAAGAERVAKAEACVGRLRALTYGARVGALGPAEIDAAYQDLLKDYSAIV